MALSGRDDDRAWRLRRAIEHRRTPEFRVQFHGVVRQKSRLVADIRLLCGALRDRKHETGRGNNHPDQVPKFGHPRLSRSDAAECLRCLPNRWNHQISGMARWQAIRRSRWNAFNFRQLPMAWECPESLTSARAIASRNRIRGRRCRPRRAKVGQTTTGAAPAVAAFAPDASMIAAFGPYLAAEYPIGPRGITENERDKNGNANQHEELAALGRCRLPDGDALRHDIGPHADAEASIGQREQRKRQKERLVIPLVGEAAQQQEGYAGYGDRYRRG